MKAFTKVSDEPLTREERKHPLAECENCPLGRVGKYVPSRFPSGTNPTGLAFVGEAPAKNEIRQGEPFVGPSGRLLNAVLTHYGVDRDNVLLTNACSCHYPDSMKKLPQGAIDACRPRLLSELQEASVDTVVTMGNSASSPLLPKDETKRGITKLRAGPPKKVELTVEESNLSLEVVPTFHPAYCLRSQGMFPLMLGDISKALHKERPVLWYEPTVVVVDNPGEAADILVQITSLNRGEGIVVDIEGGPEKDTTYGRADLRYGKVLCVGIGPSNISDQDTVYVFTDKALDKDYTRTLLHECLMECGVDAQNGKFDIGVLMNFLESKKPYPLNFDTMIASYVCYEVGGIHGLKYMGQELLGAPEWEEEIKEHISKEEGYGSIPRDLLYKYNAFDVHATRILKGYFKNLVEEQGLTRLNDWLTHRVSKMLTKVEARGMGFDLAQSRETQAELDIQIAELREKFPFFDYTTKKGTREVQLNPGSWMQLQQWLNQNGIRTESTDEDHLKAIIEHRKTPDHVKEVLERTLETRGVSKLKGTYVDGIQNKLSPSGRVHTTYLIHGTTTGRLSSRGPNLQNVPRKGPIKKQFIPHKGNKLLGLDFAQAELRVLTWLAKEPTLQAIFDDPNQDLFTELCRRMVPGFDEMSKEDKQETRTLIKTFAYGVSYGRTAAGIAADPAFNMSVSEAQAQMDLFNQGIPAVKAFQHEVVRRIHRGEDLINPFGRHRRFYLITDANRTSVENEAMAYLPQSTASDICLEAACRLSDEGIYIVNLVHDAIYAEAPPDEIDDTIALMDKVMVQVGEEVTEGYVKFKTSHKIGDRWSDV